MKRLLFALALFAALASAQVSASLVSAYNPCAVIGPSLGCVGSDELVAFVALSGSGPALVTMHYVSEGVTQSQTFAVDVRGSDLCVFLLPGDAAGLSLSVAPVLRVTQRHRSY